METEEVEVEAKVKIGKVTATPLLFINERIRPRTMPFIVMFVLFFTGCRLIAIQATGNLFSFSVADIMILIIPFVWLLPFRSKFVLCEEGVGLRKQFSRWDSFRSFTVNDRKKTFQLKTSAGSLQLTSREHFDEVKQILSKHIPPKP